MIPLRYVDLSTVDIPPSPKRGVPMSLERAILLVLLDPELKYFPIDIARIANEFQPVGICELARRRVVVNDRRGYADLAQASGHVTNPQLTGAEWAHLVRASLGGIVQLMSELHDAMKAQPGVVFALSEGKIVPHTDQTLKLEPFRPSGRRYRRKHLVVASPTSTPDSATTPVLQATIDLAGSPVALDSKVPTGRLSRFRRALKRYGWMSGAFLCLFWLGEVVLRSKDTVSFGPYAFPAPKQANPIASTRVTAPEFRQQADRLIGRVENNPLSTDPLGEISADDPLIRIMNATRDHERFQIGVTHFDPINGTSGPDLRDIKVNLGGTGD